MACVVFVNSTATQVLFSMQCSTRVSTGRPPSTSSDSTSPSATSSLKPSAVHGPLAVGIVIMLLSHYRICPLQIFLGVFPFGLFLRDNAAVFFAKTLAAQS